MRAGKQSMKEIMRRVESLHSWKMTAREAGALQRRLASSVSLEDAPATKNPRIVAAFDVSSKRFGRRLYAVAVMWDARRRKVVEVLRASVEAAFPYVPGLLSFREMPAMIEVMRKMGGAPDLLLCDAQGILHPRGLGLASHAGVATGLPSIGCAKSRLCGDHCEVGPEKGDRTPVTLGGKKAGYVLRTRRGVKPLYVSPGHGISCERAVDIVLSFVGTVRVPEPLRAAHTQSVLFMRSGEGAGPL